MIKIFNWYYANRHGRGEGLFACVIGALLLLVTAGICYVVGSILIVGYHVFTRNFHIHLSFKDFQTFTLFIFIAILGFLIVYGVGSVLLYFAEDIIDKIEERRRKKFGV